MGDDVVELLTGKIMFENIGAGKLNIAQPRRQGVAFGLLDVNLG